MTHLSPLTPVPPIARATSPPPTVPALAPRRAPLPPTPTGGACPSGGRRSRRVGGANHGPHPLPPPTDPYAGDPGHAGPRGGGCGATPHRVGRPAACACDYLVGQGNELGLPTGVQRDPASGAQNVVVRLPGSGHSGRDVLITAHYDSASSAPGAADDGISVAALVETMRVLAAQEPLEIDILFLFTDGEENRQTGIAAFVNDYPAADRVSVAFAFEASPESGGNEMRTTTPGGARRHDGRARAAFRGSRSLPGSHRGSRPGLLHRARPGPRYLPGVGGSNAGRGRGRSVRRPAHRRLETPAPARPAPCGRRSCRPRVRPHRHRCQLGRLACSARAESGLRSHAALPRLRAQHHRHGCPPDDHGGGVRRGQLLDFATYRCCRAHFRGTRMVDGRCAAARRRRTPVQSGRVVAIGRRHRRPCRHHPDPTAVAPRCGSRPRRRTRPRGLGTSSRPGDPQRRARPTRRHAGAVAPPGNPASPAPQYHHDGGSGSYFPGRVRSTGDPGQADVRLARGHLGLRTLHTHQLIAGWPRTRHPGCGGGRPTGQGAGYSGVFSFSSKKARTRSTPSCWRCSVRVACLRPGNSTAMKLVPSSRRRVSKRVPTAGSSS